MVQAAGVGMRELPGWPSVGMVSESGSSGEEMSMSRSHGHRLFDPPVEYQFIGSPLNRHDNTPKSRFSREGTPAGHPGKTTSDLEMMKERFAKLLLGEDMSGGGKGVSSALALSNAITNLAASVFGEQTRLEPMSPERKTRWRREIDWLLSVTDHIVEFVPSQQKSKDGTSMEIMVTKQRSDLLVNIPALRKLDTMLLDYLENFRDHNEFWYVKRDSEEPRGNNQRQDDKWWLPKPQVPPNGLSDVSRRWLQFQKDSVNQVLKAAMAINAQVLSEMQIPESYTESLPKNGRACLGDQLYKCITVDYFDPTQLLSHLDLSTEHKVLDLKNRIEASIVIWKRKMNNKDSKSAWGSAVSLEKRELFEERAETILLLLKHKFPGIPQSTLDISNIQYNKDVGQAVLEGYSRILESLAFTVMSRIEDVLHADSLTQHPELVRANRPLAMSSPITGPVKFPNPSEAMERLNALDAPSSMTLSDFMGWHMLDQEMEENNEEPDSWVKKEPDPWVSRLSTDGSKLKGKPPTILTNKKLSYIEKLENLGGLRSPTSRH